MANLINMPRAAWKRQPDKLSSINSQWSGVIGAWLPLCDRGYDCVQRVNNVSSALTGFTRSVKSNGFAISFSGSGAGFLSKKSQSTNQLSFCISFYNAGSQNSRILWSTPLEIIPVNTNDGCNVYISGTSRFYIPLPASVEITLAFSYNNSSSSNDPIVFINGNEVTVTRLSTPATPSLAVTYLLCNHFTIAKPLLGYTYMGAVMERAYSKSECAELTKNPWQLFDPSPSRFYLIPSSGGVLTLVIQKATHGHSVDAPSLTQAHVLALADSLHGHSVESPILSQSYALTLAAAAHAHNANNLDLSQAHSLTMTEASHNHSAEAPLLTQAHILNLSDALHGHSAEATTLTLASSLIVAEANHTHSADAPSLTQAHTITLQDASHSHSVESIVLTQAYVLVAADTAHSHSGEAITLSTELNLAIADALHSHTVEEPRLTQAHVLSLADALHSHTAESVSMGQGYSLIVAEATHSHSVESPTVSVAFILAVQDALHSQAADALLLATHVTLIVSDALHAHLAGTATEITLPTGDRVFLVAYEDRLFLVATEDRVFGV